MAGKKNVIGTPSESDKLLPVTQETGADFDTIIKNTDLKALYKLRCEAVGYYLSSHNIDAVVLEDCEERPDSSIRYLSGHPNNAILIITAKGKSILIPWDENLAALCAHADKVIPYTRYNRNNLKAVSTVLNTIQTESKGTVEIPAVTPYPLFLQYVEAVNNWDIRCHNGSTHDFITNMRAVKDDYEIACTRKACSITSHITDVIEKQLRTGKIKTESDVALLIEKLLRDEGCERTGFDTLAAGPSRSYAIHAFPGYTGGLWGTKGLSILDYGVVYNGYTSDVTLTIAKGPLSSEQKKLLSLVQTAACSCLPLYKAGSSILAAHTKAEQIFAKEKKVMPHGLGHGIGLDIHEYPFVAKKAEPDGVFRPGMIVTLEPGLYDPELGGVRLENDVLICDEGNLILTNSRIITL